MTALDPLIGIMDEQVKGYISLVALLQRERECLRDLDAAGFERISKEKDTLLLKLKLLEYERIRLVKKHFDEDITLRRMWEITGENIFMEIRSKLISLVQTIEELNRFNKVLIEKSLGYIRSTAGFFGLEDHARGSYVSREI